MEAKATSRFTRVAPNKARQVIRQIKGLEIDEARRLLAVSPKDVARQIRKTLDSAVANAEHNGDLDEDDLVITEVYVDEGPTLRRYQARAMGRAYRIRKRTSHITVKVGLRETELAVAAARAATTAAERPAPEEPAEPETTDDVAQADAPDADVADEGEPEAGKEE
jgi:large subunit ribosomal protein L22